MTVVGVQLSWWCCDDSCRSAAVVVLWWQASECSFRGVVVTVVGVQLQWCCGWVKVRDEAITTLVEMYRHVGERLRVDVSKKDINSAKYGVIVTTVFCSGYLWRFATSHFSINACCLARSQDHALKLHRVSKICHLWFATSLTFKNQ